MSPKFNYYDAPAQPFDFSPLLQGAQAEAEAARFAATAIAHGIQERARRGQDQRQFDAKLAAQRAIQAAEERRADAADRRAMAVDERAARTESRLLLGEERRMSNEARTARRQEELDARKAAEDTDTRSMVEGTLGVPRGTFGQADPQSILSAQGLGRNLAADRAKAEEQAAVTPVHQLAMSLPPGGIGGLTGSPDFAKLSPTDQRAALQLGLTNMMRQAREQQQAKKQQDLATETARTRDLIAALSERKVLSPDQTQALGARVDREPGAVAREALGVATKRADTAAEQSLIDAASKRWNAQAGEMEKLGQHDQAGVLRNHAAAVANGALKGDALRREIYANDRLAEGLAPKEPSKPEEPPEIQTPSGKKYQDTLGFSKGGSVTDLNADPKKMAWLTGIAMQEAASDPRYPKTAELSKLALPIPEEGEAGRAARERELQRLTILRDALVAEHGNRIAAMYGWEMPGRGSQKATDTASAFAERIRAGEFGDSDALDEAKLQAALKEAGLTEDAVLKAGGGGGR